jgi:GTP-binding protein YchF
VDIPDSRIDSLVGIYSPEKTISANLMVVDIPSFEIGSSNEKAYSAKLLAHLKDSDALLHVIRCFPRDNDDLNPVGDADILDLEMMLADIQTLTNKIERLQKKARSGDSEVIKESDHCKKVKSGLESGVAARRQDLTETELQSVNECNLVSLKPVVYVANVKTTQDSTSEFVRALESRAQEEGSEVVVVSGQDEADISQMDISDRQDFLNELGLSESSMVRLLRSAYKCLGMLNFFTVGEDEVRAWTCRQGDKAPVAAGKIHKDMQKGFIRMEVMRAEDLIQLGSETAVVKAGKKKVEGKDYLVQEGDVVVVLFNKG